MAGAEAPIDVEMVRAFLARVLPSFADGDLSQISGSDFATWDVAGEWILRFAFNSGGAEQLEREATALPWLAPRLPLSVPEIAFKTVGKEPLPVIGYRKLNGLSGESLRPDRWRWPALAESLGSFLSALHGSPIERPELRGLPMTTPRDFEGGLKDLRNYSSIVREREPALVNRLVDRYLDGAVEVPAPSHELVVSHDDLKGEHVLLDQGGTQLTAVIDWGDLALTDPAVDVAGLAIWLGEEFIAEVAAAYDVRRAEELCERGLFLVRTRMLRGLGRALAGENNWPLDLVRTQIRWAFAPHGELVD